MGGLISVDALTEIRGYLAGPVASLKNKARPTSLINKPVYSVRKIRRYRKMAPPVKINAPFN